MGCHSDDEFKTDKTIFFALYLDNIEMTPRDL